MNECSVLPLVTYQNKMILHYELFDCSFAKSFNLVSEFLTCNFKLDLTNLKGISIPTEILTAMIIKKDQTN